MRNGPILLIDDDDDDQLLFQAVVRDLGIPNPIRFFVNGQQVLDYLLTTSEQPFVILCDINMPSMNGLELRQRIEANQALKQKAIPFVFLTTDASPPLIEEAYKGTIQGFFKKSVSHEAAKEQLRWIMGYWQHCLHPQSVPSAGR